MLNRSCPVCNSEQTKFNFNQKFSSFSQGTLLKSYDVVSCVNCGFLYADKIPDQATFNTYYENLSKYEGEFNGIYSESIYDLNRFTVISKYIKNYLGDKSSKTVEVGCSTGFFLSKLNELGFDNLTGIDPSPNCSLISKKYYDIEVLTGNLSNMNALVEEVDNLILIGVLEHVRDLESSIQNMFKSLKVGGKLIIQVPDASEYYNGLDAAYQEFSIEHINYFGPLSLNNLLGRYNFKNVAYEQTMIEVNKNTFTPALISVFEKLGEEYNYELIFDVELVDNMEKYISKSFNEEKIIKQLIDKVFKSNKGVYIWGTGAQTLRLLENSNLKYCEIVSFIDSNKKYQGKNINGIKILAPTDIKDSNVDIIISTRAYQDQIEEYIINDLKLNNNVIKLY
jgi:SAM-dependent methyltransferase